MTDNPLDPGPDAEARIQIRAYHLWESEGRPEGREQEYWERALELQGMADSAGAGTLPNPESPEGRRREAAIDEAQIQENLGEFPHGGLRDQGDRMETPVSREKMDELETIRNEAVQTKTAKPNKTTKNT